MDSENYICYKCILMLSVIKSHQRMTHSTSGSMELSMSYVLTVEVIKEVKTIN